MQVVRIDLDDPVVLKALGWSLPLSTLLGGLALAGLWDEGPLIAIGGGLLAFVLGVAVVGGGTIALSTITARAAGAVLLPSGRSTPSPDDYSLQKAMLARGSIGEALFSIEGLLAQKPGDPALCLFAADVYTREGADLHRAETLFQRVRTLPRTTDAQDLYATNRLIDLYTGGLENPARAAEELNRVLHRHPTSPTAAQVPRVLRELAESSGRAGEGG